MSDIKSRLNQVVSLVTGQSSQDPGQIPWNPENGIFPKLVDLKPIENAPKGAAWVWGKDDSLGRINLLTPSRVKAASAEIKTGETIPLSLSLNEPDPPAFGREPFEHTIKPLAPNAFDDKYALNTQSSTQWDGFRHVGHPSGVFYNGVTADTIKRSTAHDHSASHASGLQDVAAHGIAARAILLDFATWSRSNPSTVINPFERETISLDSLLACGKSQGLNLTPAHEGGDVRPGDILLIRIGFTAKYRLSSKSEWEAAATRDRASQQWAGIDGGSDELRSWVHDCYFAAVASDAPALEAWPPLDEQRCLHTSMLPLWGCLIGEFFDLERLATRCREQGRWTVFFTSAPPIVNGGVGASTNALAVL